jgi:hypothetical protein
MLPAPEPEPSALHQLRLTAPSRPLLPAPSRPLLPAPSRPLLPAPSRPLLPVPSRPLLPAPPLQPEPPQFPTRPQHGAPPMRLPVPPQPPIRLLDPNTKSERPNRSKRLQDIMLSLIVDQKQYMNQQLLSFKNTFSLGLLCTACWAAGAPCDHPLEDCAHFQFSNNSAFRLWKSYLQLPTYHCFTCCLPQVSALLTAYHDYVGVDYLKERVCTSQQCSWEALHPGRFYPTYRLDLLVRCQSTTITSQQISGLERQK